MAKDLLSAKLSPRDWSLPCRDLTSIPKDAGARLDNPLVDLLKNFKTADDTVKIRPQSRGLIVSTSSKF